MKKKEKSWLDRMYKFIIKNRKLFDDKDYLPVHCILCDKNFHPKAFEDHLKMEHPNEYKNGTW